MAEPQVPALSVEALRKEYGHHLALDNVSLNIRQGEFFGLVGENGAGKTTLIKCVLDFCDTQSGHIRLFGLDHRKTAARAKVAFLPERFNPPHFMTGREFLHFMAELHRHPQDEEKARSAASALQLDPAALDRQARRYSKGMTQKLGLAACLLSGKPMLILDEPTSGLDPKARALLKAALRQLHAEGRTIIMTSHALSDVEEMCSQMAVVHDRELRYSGTPAEFLTTYRASRLEDAYLACIA
jgi:ABC-2 type transport system ATP-binding protein